jgi:UDP-galactopyranose mutase
MRRGAAQMSTPDLVVVGAGFSGCTLARIVAEAGHRVHVVERREHIGGNAYDELDAHGVRIHRYGPHIFHTNAERIVEFLSRFTAWRPYQHRVRAMVRGRLVPFPINRTTLNLVYGLDLDEAGARRFLAAAAIDRGEPRTSEDVVLARVGAELCDLLFRGYTRKQWGLELSDLAPSVAARIGARASDDDRYFTDRFQCMPAEGYTPVFARMLAHPAITVETGVDALADRARLDARHCVYTGPIDAWYGGRFGALPYRSIRFEHAHQKDVAQFQPVGTVNFPGDEPYTRITEFRHLTGQPHEGTSIVREIPCDGGEPLYPVPRPANAAIYQRYRALADAETRVTFVGRLAQYRYYNLDQAVAAAMTAARRVIERLAAG